MANSNEKNHPKSLKNAKYACSHCPTKASWPNVQDLSKHFDKHKGNKFLCYYCGDVISKHGKWNIIR